MARSSRVAEKERVLLTALEEDADFVRACKVAGVPRRTGYFWRERYADFREKCTIAIAIGAARRHRNAWTPSEAPPAAVDLGSTLDRVLGAT